MVWAYTTVTVSHWSFFGNRISFYSVSQWSTQAPRKGKVLHGNGRLPYNASKVDFLQAFRYDYGNQWRCFCSDINMDTGLLLDTDCCSRRRSLFQYSASHNRKKTFLPRLSWSHHSNLQHSWTSWLGTDLVWLDALLCNFLAAGRRLEWLAPQGRSRHIFKQANCLSQVCCYCTLVFVFDGPERSVTVVKRRDSVTYWVRRVLPLLDRSYQVN